jgi:hypothetical protein
MKITHKLSETFSKECTDRNLSIFMLSKLGNYFSLPANPKENISNYSGYLLNLDGSMFKTMDNIYLADNEGNKKIPYEIVNNFNSIERLYDGYYEKFTLVKNGLIYDIESEEKSEENIHIDIELDFRWINDCDDNGREYKIHKVDDSLVIEYNKYIDDSLREKSFTKYLILNGVHDAYEIPAKWIKKNYSYDASRNSRSEYYVYHAIRLLNKGKNRLIFTFAEKKSDAIDKLLDIKKNAKLIDGIHESYEENHLGRKYNISQVTGKESAFGYVNAVHAIDGLMIRSKDIYGLWAGLPWFFQYWSRDELISLKALILEEKKDFVKEVLSRHINAIQPNGRLPNIYTSNGPSGLGSADSIGWLFRRIKDVLALAEDNGFGVGDSIKGDSNYFGLYEIKYIRERLQFSIKQLLNNHYREGLIRNEPLETWMDTSIDNDSREGFRIEIQCQFLCMLNLMNMLNHLLANKFVKKHNKLINVTQPELDYRQLERDTAKIVRERFFIDGYLNDGWNCSNSYVSRPNVFLAYYMYPELLLHEEWEKVFDNLIPRLWVEWDIDGKQAGGFSTIDKENYLYQPNYTGQDNRSYHRGDMWFYINNIAAICLNSLNKEKYFSYVKKILNASTEDMLFRGFIGYSSEVSSSSKLEPAGCFCQAWSIATYIELIHEMFIK